MRECRAEGCPHLAADGCNYCVQHDEPDPSDCGCSFEWRKPKPNGTCATCGGWLPGERPRPFFASLTSPRKDAS